MGKKSIVIVLVLTLLITLSLAGTALARLSAVGYWSGGDKVTFTVRTSQVDISWPATGVPVEGYTVTINKGKSQVGYYLAIPGTGCSFSPVSGSGRYTVDVLAVINGNAVDTLQGGSRWTAP